MDIFLTGLGLCVALCTLIRWTLFKSVGEERGRAAILYPNLYMLLIQVICGSTIDGLLQQREGIGFVIVTAATIETYALWMRLNPDKRGPPRKK